MLIWDLSRRMKKIKKNNEDSETAVWDSNKIQKQTKQTKQP
jgi:hypothetical protein